MWKMCLFAVVANVINHQLAIRVTLLRVFNLIVVILVTITAAFSIIVDRSSICIQMKAA